MNILDFVLNFELNHFSARFNEKMNFQNVSNRANGNTLLLAGLRFSPHKEARTFHKSLQEVKYARLLGRQGKRRTHVF